MCLRLSECLGFATRPSPVGARRAGAHAQTLHKRTFTQLEIPHVQLDEVCTRLRSHTQVLWLWAALDPVMCKNCIRTVEHWWCCKKENRCHGNSLRRCTRAARLGTVRIGLGSGTEGGASALDRNPDASRAQASKRAKGILLSNRRQTHEVSWRLSLSKQSAKPTGVQFF